MLSRSAVLVIAAGFLPMLGTGCAANPPAAAVLSQAVAPTQSQSQHPDPNAPYMIPAPARPAATPPARPADAHAPLCSPDALKVQEISGNVHGAYHSAKLGFRNQTGVACQLGGYPVVALFNGQGQTVGSIAVERTTEAAVRAELAESAQQQGAQPPATEKSPGSAAAPATAGSSAPVVLMPKEVAAFEVVWSAGQGCPSVARLLVTAPGTTRSFSVAQPMSVCTGRIQVTPLGLDQGDD